MPIVSFGVCLWALSTIPGVNLGTGLIIALAALFLAISDSGIPARR